MSGPGDGLLALQVRESVRQLLGAVRPAGPLTGLGEQLEATSEELCWEVGLTDVSAEEVGDDVLDRGWPRLDHVGLLVADLALAARLYADQLGGVVVAGGDAPHEGIRTLHLRYPGGGKVELLTPLGDGPAARQLATRGEGVHHLTFSGYDVASTAATLGAQGVRVSALDVSSSYMHQLFVGPRSASGVAVQVVDRADHYAGSGRAVPTLDEVLAGRWTWRDGSPQESAG